MQNYTYIIEIDTFNVIEKYTAPSISQAHKLLTDKLHQLYIAFTKDEFIKLRMMQIHMQRTKINDFLLFKVEQSVIKIYKLKYQPTQKEETTLQEI
jgi:hypothetical protein